jgi:hypothetical protein
MAIILPGGFQITNNEPADSRYSVANSSSRLGFSAANVYEGLTVYQRDTNKYYILIDTASYNLEIGWQEVGASINTGSFATTGSNLFIGNQGITGSLFVSSSGYFNQLFMTNSYVSNNLYVTGSTIFGSSQSNTHQFTGSVSVTGSISVSGGNTTFDGDELEFTGSALFTGSLQVEGEFILPSTNSLPLISSTGSLIISASSAYLYL